MPQCRCRRRRARCSAPSASIVFTLGERRYRVRGLEKNLSLQSLKVNCWSAQGDLVHVDTLDLYAARARGGFITQAANELGVKEESDQGRSRPRAVAAVKRCRSRHCGGTGSRNRWLSR